MDYSTAIFTIPGGATNVDDLELRIHSLNVTCDRFKGMQQHQLRDSNRLHYLSVYSIAHNGSIVTVTNEAFPGFSMTKLCTDAVTDMQEIIDEFKPLYEGGMLQTSIESREYGWPSRNTKHSLIESADVLN
jgi:hypothetical protein